jgi:hypothetical protein
VRLTNEAARDGKVSISVRAWWSADSAIGYDGREEKQDDE